MNYKHLILSFIFIITTFGFVKSQITNENLTPKDDLDLRQILANQPDYTAIEQTIFSEGFGGFSGESKVIKSGKRSVEIKSDIIFIAVPGKPLIRVFPKDKTYALSKPEEDNSIFSPKELARNQNTVFKFLGIENIGNYDCIKFEVTFKKIGKKATPKDKRLESTKFVFWSASKLKNLIIRSESTLGNDAKFTISLKEISLTVDEEYFRIPKGFKRIIYKIDE